MRIDFRTSGVELDANQQELIHKKVTKLERFYDHIIDCLIYVSKEGHSAKHNEHSIELKLNVKDSTLFCKETSESIEQSIDQAVDAMSRQLKKYKEKHG